MEEVKLKRLVAGVPRSMCATVQVQLVQRELRMDFFPRSASAFLYGGTVNHIGPTPASHGKCKIASHQTLCMVPCCIW
jgi:hypothetical protein